MDIKQIGAFIVIGAGAYGYTQYAEGADYAAKAKEFQLSEAQVTVMRSCNASLARHSRKFKEDIDQIRGCACLAKRLTTDIQPDKYTAASDVLDLMIERSKGKNSGNVMQQIKAKPTLAKLDQAVTIKLFMAASTSVGFCGKRANLDGQAVANVKIPNFSTPKN